MCGLSFSLHELEYLPSQPFGGFLFSFANQPRLSRYLFAKTRIVPEPTQDRRKKGRKERDPGKNFELTVES